MPAHRRRGHRRTTFLGAHVVPARVRGAHRRLRRIGLRRRCSTRAHRTPAGSTPSARTGRSMSTNRVPSSPPAARPGLGAGLHANQLGYGPGVRLAVEMGCASADHCTFLERRRPRLAGRERHGRHVPARRRLLDPPALPGRPAGDRRRCRGGDRHQLQPRLELHDLDGVLPGTGRARHAHDDGGGDRRPRPWAGHGRCAETTSAGSRRARGPTSSCSTRRRTHTSSTALVYRWSQPSSAPAGSPSPTADRAREPGYASLPGGPRGLVIRLEEGPECSVALSRGGAIIVALVVAAVLAACGSDSSTGDRDKNGRGLVDHQGQHGRRAGRRPGAGGDQEQGHAQGRR